AIDGSGQVDRDRLHPLIPIDGVDRSHWTVDTGVGDQNVHPAEARLRFVEESVDVAATGDVCGLRPDAIGAVGRREPFLLRVELVRTAAAQGYVGAISQEVLGDRSTETLARAGDDSCAAGKSHATRPIETTVRPGSFRTAEARNAAGSSSRRPLI